MNYTYITNKDDLLLGMGRVESDVVALDIETFIKKGCETLTKTALDYHLNDIGLISLKGDPDEILVIDPIWFNTRGESLDVLFDWLEQRKRVLMHNAAFDLTVMYTVYNRLLRNAGCTMLLAQLLGNATGSKFSKFRGLSLDDLCRDFLDVNLKGKGTIQLMDWGISVEARDINTNSQWREMVEYSATDVQYLKPLWDLLEPLIINPLPPSMLNPNIISTPTSPPLKPGLGMKDILELEMAYLSVTATMHSNGLPYRSDVGTQLQLTFQDECNEVAYELCQQLGLETYCPSLDYDDLPTPASEKILNNPVKMQQILTSNLDIDIDTTQSQFLTRVLEVIEAYSKENVLEFRDDEESSLFEELNRVETSVLVERSKLLSLYMKYKKLKKQTTMNLEPYSNPLTNSIHSSYSQLGAATGRLCIAKGMRVATVDDGYIPIEDIAVGMRVYTMRPNGTITHRRVLDKINKGVAPTVVSTLDTFDKDISTSVRTTIDHHVRLSGGHWVPIGRLVSGISVSGLTLKEPFRGTDYYWVTTKKVHNITVFDIEVEEYHNFFCEGICCHNSSRSPNAQQISARIETVLDLDPTTMEVLEEDEDG